MKVFKRDGEKDQQEAEELGLTDKPAYKEKSKGDTSMESTKQHESHAKSDVHLEAEAELKRKGLKPIDYDSAAFVPVTLEDQKYLHANDTDGWKTMHETIRDLKQKASEKAKEIDLKKQEEELKLLKVKRYDEDKKKPDFLCVVKGCGEEKAPGQGFHCTAHCKGS